MFQHNIINPLIREVLRNPDKTAARIGDSVVSNAQFFQLVAPVMNEIDALSVQRVALVMKPDTNVCAAILAAAFSNVTVVPLPENAPEEFVQKVMEELNISTVLTAERMHYYYWMTFEDAMSRIDNGLYDIDDDNVLWMEFSMNGGALSADRIVRAGDFEYRKNLNFEVFFKSLLTSYPEVCSIF